MKNIKKNIDNFNININKDDPTINDFLYCWMVFDSRPNRLTIFNSYSSKTFSDILDSIVKNKSIHTEIIPADIDSIINDQVLLELNNGIFISYLILDRNNENSTINEITFYYKTEDDYKKVIEIIHLIDQCVISYQLESNLKLNTISISQGSFEIEPLSISDSNFESIDLFYTEKTFSTIEKLVKKIKKSNKGLSILYGERGNGKTSLINYLATKLDRIVIFIPNNLIEQTINNPEFRKFLKKHVKPIIVIDDCEMLFNEVFAKSNPFVNNLLQMVDGFLSDFIEVNVISIFNVEDEDEIDHSLLDCNNLLEIVKFDFLSDEESCELSKHLGHNKKYKNKTKLVDVVKKRDTKESSDIGF